MPEHECSIPALHKFSKKKPPQNSRWQKGDMKKCPHWQSTNRCHCTKFKCHSNLAPRICAPLFNTINMNMSWTQVWPNFILTTYFPKAHFNVILPRPSHPFKWPLSHKKLLHMSYLTHPHYMPGLPLRASLHFLNNAMWRVEVTRASSWNTLKSPLKDMKKTDKFKHSSLHFTSSHLKIT